MSRDWILREQGSRDWRMLPIAIVMWAASLGAHALFAWRMSDGLGTGQAKADAGAGIDVTIIGMEWPVTRILPITVASCAAVAAMIVVSFRLRIRWTGTLTVCVAVACIGSMTAIASDTIAWHDPASAQARQSSSYHEVMATVTTPVIASDQRTYDCQTDIRLSGITVDGTDVRSTVAVRVYADESYCGQLRRGAVYLLTGVLQQARYGRIPLWLLLEGKQPVAQVRAPPWHLAAIAHVQEAFFTVTEQLSDQGRVLVPGLTMGVLGQDYIGGETGPMPVNSTYAQTLENQFRQSGIMHLMAVSGGHFVLVAGLVRRLCMWMLLDRRLTALLVSGVYVLLALAMFPSDSVTRAFIMGLIGALTYAMGRRTQALSALCWTVIGVLAVNPDMSASYGFALSSAAVLGIVLFAGRLAGAFERAMPHGHRRNDGDDRGRAVVHPADSGVDGTGVAVAVRAGEPVGVAVCGIGHDGGIDGIGLRMVRAMAGRRIRVDIVMGHAGDGTGGVVAGWQHDGRHPMERWRYGCRADCGGGNRYRHATGVRQPLPPACPSL